jgi:hypothetical protein
MEHLPHSLSGNELCMNQKSCQGFTIPEIRRLLNPGKSAKDMCIKKSAGLLLTLGARVLHQPLFGFVEVSSPVPIGRSPVPVGKS